MEMRHLRYFVALADCLSFTRAAERVHVTQSTLSHQIKQLEDELGQPLFERIGKKVVTTEAGELLRGFASRALKEVDQGVALLKAGPWRLPNLVLVSRWELVAPDVPGAQPSAAVAASKPKPVVDKNPLQLATDQALPAAGSSGAASPPDPPVLSLQTLMAMPSEPGLYRLNPSVERGDGRPLPRGWQLAPMEMRVWGDRGAVVLPAPPAETAAAGQGLTVSVAVEDAGAAAWTYGDLGPQVGEDATSTQTQLEVTWVDADGGAR